MSELQQVLFSKDLNNQGGTAAGSSLTIPWLLLPGTNQNLNVKTGNIETFSSEENFDLVSMIQVIGHVYDLDIALQSVNLLLKPQGLVLVESWNMNSAIARVMGKRWHEYSPPSVAHWYSDETLTQFFNYYGFKLVSKGYPVKKISMEHAFSFLEGKTSSPMLKKLRHSMNGFSKKVRSYLSAS